MKIAYGMVVAGGFVALCLVAVVMAPVWIAAWIHERFEGKYGKNGSNDRSVLTSAAT